MSKTLVGGMLVGRVDFGESSQARSASYSAEDSMAASIVRLECEAEELRATLAMLQEQARILAEERDAARTELEMWRDGNIMHEIHRDELEKAERERDEAIQERERWKMQAEQKWAMRRELEDLLGVKDTECDQQFAKGLAALRDLIQERDEAIGSLCSTDCPPDTGDDALHNVRRLRAQIRELDRENARLWTPIESAPRDGTVILASDGLDYFICRWADCSGVSSVKARHGWATTYDHASMAYDDEHPTHWMPLPSLPNSV